MPSRPRLTPECSSRYSFHSVIVTEHPTQLLLEDLSRTCLRQHAEVIAAWNLEARETLIQMRAKIVTIDMVPGFDGNPCNGAFVLTLVGS